MERINIKLKDNTEITLSFSMYFLDSVSKMLGTGIQGVLQRLLGENIYNEDGKPIGVIGGILDDLEVRGAVLASGVNAFNFDNKVYSKLSLFDGFELIEKIENSIANPIWSEVYTSVVKSIVADKLKVEEEKESENTTKKKTTKKLPLKN